MIRLILFFILGIIIACLAFYLLRTEETGITVETRAANEHLTMFPNQCIDTMKVSRDKARSLANNPQADTIIQKQVEKIKSMGATCVAIGTPYDEEFQPYMRKWVAAIRKAGLHVWFRGNWSGWEGWFNYEKNLTPEEHIRKTEAFILTHADLFENGDIFSPIVEPENGGPFHPVNTQEKTHSLRTFLSNEQLVVKNAFASLGKEVTTSWISMSGGVAKSVIDRGTVSSLDNTVTLDHYTASREGMREYIRLFADPYKAAIVLGEFGAPIPDINGSMTNDEQKVFVDSLFWELFLNRSVITGVNYWTLSESSTALITQDGVDKPVTEVVKRYYMPGKLQIHAMNEHGRAMKNTIITIQDDEVLEKTNDKGQAVLLLPQGQYTLKLVTPTGRQLTTPIVITAQTGTFVKAVFSE